MTTDFQPSPPGNPPPPEKKNVFARIAGVLFAPVDTFADIARRPDVIAPLLIIIIVGYLCTALIVPKLDVSAITSAQAEQMRKQNPDVKEEQLATMARMTAAFVKVVSWLGPLLGVIVYAIIAGVLLLAFKLFGGEGTYHQAFSATLYAWMPLVLFSIITAIVVTAQGTFDPNAAETIVKSNAAFLVDMKEQLVLYKLLAAFDVFTIWTIALLSVGFAAVAKMSKAKAAAIVVSLWIAMLVVKLGFAAFTASRMKS